MNNTTVYTPLESYFLFQLLTKHGFVPGAFLRISDDLKKNALICEQETYDAERLSPGALEELSLRLLREEQRREAEVADTNGANVSPTSRKRKLPNPPPIPSIKEAQQYSNKLPQLVERLYAIYRDHIIRQVQDDERKIEALRREIVELERAEQQGPDVAKQKHITSTANGLTVAAPLGAPQVPNAGRLNGEVVQTPVPVPTPLAQSNLKSAPATPAPQPPGAAARDQRPAQPSPSSRPPIARATSEVRPPALNGRPQEVPRPANGPKPVLQHPQAAQAHAAPPTSVTPQPTVADGLQRPEAVPKSFSPVPRPASQPQAGGQLKWEPPYRPQHQTPVPPPYVATGVRSPSYPQQIQPGQITQQQQQYQSYVGNRQPSQPTVQPQPNRALTPGGGHPPYQPPHPVLLPPQNTAQPSPSLQSLPGDATVDGSVQRYRQTSVPVSVAQSAQASPRSPNVAVTASPYAQQQMPYYPGQTPVRPPLAISPTQSAAQVPNGASPVGHRSPTARPTHLQQAHLPHTVPNTPLPQHAGSTPMPYHQPHGTGFSQAMTVDPHRRPHIGTPGTRPLQAAPSHPPSLPHTPLALNTSHIIRGHGTRWTSTPTPSTPRMEMNGYFDDQPPPFEPISPPLHPIQPQKSPSRLSEKRDNGKRTQTLESPTSRAKRRPLRSAQKPISDAQESPIRRIKDEAATPRAFEDVGDTTADESGRSRLPSEATPRAAHKRKRGESSEAHESISHEPPRPATEILWTRSFHKVSAQALEQVTSHRHANIFAERVKSQYAPHYFETIMQPIALRDIRTAVTHGHRAAVAAEKNLPDTDSSATSVYLPAAPELIPPKGIINIMQLERELVHMFANAVMYQPDTTRRLPACFLRERPSSSHDHEVIGYEVDENGLVRDTRSMYVEVEKLLSDLRGQIENAQKHSVSGAHHGSVSRGHSLAAGDSSMAEDENEEHGDGPSTAKRRRVKG